MINLDFFTKNDLPVIYQAFMEAFADYVMDTSRVTETKFTNRAIKNGVDLEASAGAFYQNELVGFTMVALDHYCGVQAAYDAVTGIVKPYRGQGLAKKMFEYILPKLKAKGVERFYLEVIQSNEAAVRAYQKTRFSIVRELDCYKIPFETAQLDKSSAENIQIREITKEDLEPAVDFFDWEPTWENSLTSIQRTPDDILVLGAYNQEKMIGFLAYYPLLGWILNMAVHKEHRRKKIGTMLLAHLKEQIGASSSPEIINIEHSDTGMLEFLKAIGSEFVINQFEMKLDL
jgi:ribosomal protein S18 acetylase RimI-like enzyme